MMKISEKIHLVLFPGPFIVPRISFKYTSLRGVGWGQVMFGGGPVNSLSWASDLIALLPPFTPSPLPFSTSVVSAVTPASPLTPDQGQGWEVVAAATPQPRGS